MPDVNRYASVKALTLPLIEARMSRAFADDPNLNRRTQTLYVPVLNFVREILLNSKPGSPPPCIGIQAPQGSGKTTLVRWLTQTLRECDVKVAALSVDDFYLTRAAQAELAAQNPDVPYWQQRGYPGTHDLVLGTQTLRALKSTALGAVALPRYDKSLHGGRGDRAPQDRWETLTLPVDLILFEGWMLGFEPEPLTPCPDAALLKTESTLGAYDAWNKAVDHWIVLTPEHPEYVIDWRGEAEAKMRKETGSGLSDEQIRAYVRTFLPAHRRYIEPLRSRLENHPSRLLFRLAKDRLPSEAFPTGN